MPQVLQVVSCGCCAGSVVSMSVLLGEGAVDAVGTVRQTGSDATRSVHKHAVIQC